MSCTATTYCQQQTKRARHNQGCQQNETTQKPFLGQSTSTATAPCRKNHLTASQRRRLPGHLPPATTGPRRAEFSPAPRLGGSRAGGGGRLLWRDGEAEAGGGGARPRKGPGEMVRRGRAPVLARSEDQGAWEEDDKGERGSGSARVGRSPGGGRGFGLFILFNFILFHFYFCFLFKLFSFLYFTILC